VASLAGCGAWACPDVLIAALDEAMYRYAFLQGLPVFYAQPTAAATAAATATATTTATATGTGAGAGAGTAVSTEGLGVSKGRREEDPRGRRRLLAHQRCVGLEGERGSGRTGAGEGSEMGAGCGAQQGLGARQQLRLLQRGEKGPGLDSGLGGLLLGAKQQRKLLQEQERGSGMQAGSGALHGVRGTAKAEAPAGGRGGGGSGRGGDDGAGAGGGGALSGRGAPGGGGAPRVLLRSKIVARILRLGHHVLLSDPDVVWFRDPRPDLRAMRPGALLVQVSARGPVYPDYSTVYTECCF